MSAKMVRWACPSCGDGKLAPSRPRRDDVRRYCLSCSEESGRLVERVAPALERKRTERSARLAEKRKAAARRATDRERARYTVAGIELREEMARYLRLPLFKSMRRHPPKLTVSRRSSYPSKLGYASPWENAITVFDYPGCTEHDVRETLLHEMVHILSGVERGSAHWHGPRFHKTMREAARQAWGNRPARCAGEPLPRPLRRALAAGRRAGLAPGGTLRGMGKSPKRVKAGHKARAKVTAGVRKAGRASARKRRR